MKLFWEFRRISIYVITITQRHGQTDRRTSCRGNTALCLASRGKNGLALCAALVTNRC